ncbi:MAG: pyrimidine 5'-nucleotidase [Chloroflexi bacterium]|nr:pyrimidine 5'-nucleotidase [Chloroflexota bacterium]MDL1942258.1 pyrimidine 5'-nucleotidase [Chloroflexi bacterium CFX2]
MRFTTVFFDLDDTLYPSSTGLWHAIKERMNIYMRERMGFPEDQIPRIREKYFLQYGTTLRGLQANHEIDMEDFLAFVHDLPLKDYLTPNPLLRSIIASLPTRNLIFTNADVRHARRVLTALDLNDLFDTIVDVNAIAPYCKPMPESFQIAMRLAGETDPSKCVMIDDIHRTTRAARQAGLFSILYNASFADGDADAHLLDWNDLKGILERR